MLTPPLKLRPFGEIEMCVLLLLSAVGMEGNNQRRTKIFSAILIRWGVTEMGRKSDMPVGLGTFGTGVTRALSQGLGTQPVRKEQLSM